MSHVINRLGTDNIQRSQEAYEKAVTTLFKSLDRAEADLAKSPGPYYYGENITEGDVRLYTVSVLQTCLSCLLNHYRRSFDSMPVSMRNEG